MRPPQLLKYQHGGFTLFTITNNEISLLVLTISSEKTYNIIPAKYRMINPTHLYYLISQRCNERCSKCSHWKVTHHSNMVSINSIIQAVHDLNSLKELCIVGGEPLVFKKRVIELLEGIKNLPIRTILITNGVACTPEFINEVKEHNLHVIFSIDTIDPKFWKYVRGNDSYQRVMKNFHYAIQTLSLDKISVQSVLAVETIEHVKEVRKMCDQLSCFHSIQNYIQQGFDGNWTECTKENSAPVPTDQCHAVGRNISIMPDGNIFTCFQQPLMPNCSAPLGNIERSSITSLLSTNYAAKVLSTMKTCNLPCKTLKCNQ